MALHRFVCGQEVLLRADGLRSRIDYVVTALLPSDHRFPRYRVKSAHEPISREVSENLLRAQSSNETASVAMAVDAPDTEYRPAHAVASLRRRRRHTPAPLRIDGVAAERSSVPGDRFSGDLVEAISHLRAFAMSLVGNSDAADDLVQQTLMNALQARDSFTQGSNLHAWLFTILRNAFYSHHRKYRREVSDTDSHFAMKVAIAPTQLDSLEFHETLAALAKLPMHHREVLLLSTTQDLSYDEIAEICGCSVGTVKSRVSRARDKLAALLNGATSDREPLRARALLVVSSHPGSAATIRRDGVEIPDHGSEVHMPARSGPEPYPAAANPHT